MSHSHGKKRRSYTKISGHLFTKARHEKPKGFGLPEKSLCGLTVAEADSLSVVECGNCEIAKDQLWA